MYTVHVPSPATMSISNLSQFLFVLVLHLRVLNAYRVFDIDGADTILALENENVQIMCKTFTAMPMAYCGFVGPNGMRYAFSGQDLANGRCFVNINVTRMHEGTWQCHIGRTVRGLEILRNIHVRVVGYLAAVQNNVTGVYRKSVTLMCTTTQGLKPLSYCRFEPPDNKPFSIDAKVNISNAIQNRFYFPKDKSLDRGDCGVTIDKVAYEDFGIWTCGAGFDDGKEYIDSIKFEVEGLISLSTISLPGMIIGITGVIILLIIVGVVAWKNRNVLGTRRVEHESIEMGPRPRSRPGTPQRSPQATRAVPIVVVQSPSMSPLIT